MLITEQEKVNLFEAFLKRYQWVPENKEQLWEDYLVKMQYGEDKWNSSTNEEAKQKVKPLSYLSTIAKCFMLNRKVKEQKQNYLKTKNMNVSI